jgi:preprotein translocase subunit SecG
VENKNIVYIGLALLAGAFLIFWLVPASILRPVLYVLLFLGSIFLILLVLIQRGRGGGLAGAFGGMGGYSAFGTRAGDIFTRITIVAAALWILGAMALVKLNSTGSRIFEGAPSPAAKPSAQQPEITTPTIPESSSSEPTQPNASETPKEGSGESRDN